MADLAVGRNCPSCGTFTACAGSFNDPELVGKCACCGANVIAAAHGGERAHAVRAAGAFRLHRRAAPRLRLRSPLLPRSSKRSPSSLPEPEKESKNAATP